ncbi:hypothetical protein NQ315_007083 [Exocentrus adspersus]|uniref:Uncharacterized protein n=1 Tax=Exocentrus adspersus TaxID=1586481 RepID=A0AAV8WE03_9CUCU|nr:hypothetical protein NQ315_007083 [Exocentrus adspersus]
MKYPNSVTGAIASSAPIWMFKDQTPCDSFYKVVTQDFETLGSQKCRDTIQKSWKVIRTVTQNATGQIKLANLWNMCTYYQIDLKLVDWLAEVYTTLAEADSPYFTNFTVPLPANPIKEFCNVLDGLESDDDMDLVTTLGQALQIYTNYTGGSVCTIFQPTFEHLADNAWGFQKCTDMIRPVCSRDSDMFENFEFDFESYSEECFEKYEMRPLNEEVPILLYGGKELSTAKNIIFSNVLQDPWSAYGVLTNVTSDILALNIPNGARNTNLRASSENDSQELRDVRQIEVEYIEKWIATV